MFYVRFIVGIMQIYLDELPEKIKKKINSPGLIDFLKKKTYFINNS